MANERGGTAGSCRVLCVRQLKTVLFHIINITITASMISRELTHKDTKTRRSCCGGRRVMRMFLSICHCLQHIDQQTPDHSSTRTLSRISRAAVCHVHHPCVQLEWMELPGDMAVVLMMRWTASLYNSSRI